MNTENKVKKVKPDTKFFNGKLIDSVDIVMNSDEYTELHKHNKLIASHKF